MEKKRNRMKVETNSGRSWIMVSMLVVLTLTGCGEPAPPSPNPVQRMDVAEFDRIISAPEFSGLVVVFASWCPPCRDELPDTARLYRSGLPRGLQLVAMSLDEGDSRTVQRLVNELRIPFPVYQVGMPGTARYQIVGVPMLLLVDNGRIVEKIPGRQTLAQLNAHLERLARPKP